MCIDYSQTINLFTELDAYPLPRIDDIINKLHKKNLKKQTKISIQVVLNIPPKKCLPPNTNKGVREEEVLGDLYEFTVLPFGVTNGVPCFQRTMDNIHHRGGTNRHVSVH